MRPKRRNAAANAAITAGLPFHGVWIVGKTPAGMGTPEPDDRDTPPTVPVSVEWVTVTGIDNPTDVIPVEVLNSAVHRVIATLVSRDPACAPLFTPLPV